MPDKQPETPEDVDAIYLLGTSWLSAFLRNDDEALTVIHKDAGCGELINALTWCALSFAQWHSVDPELDADDTVLEVHAVIERLTQSIIANAIERGER